MIATHEVPASVLARIERTLFTTRNPWLAAPRPGEWALGALECEQGFLLVLHPQSPPGQVHAAQREGDGRLLERLAAGAVKVLAGMPRRFTCAGRVVGVVDADDSAVVARGPVALSLLSRVLRERRV